jgi:cytochrome b
MAWLMKLAFRRRESPEEARQRRLCRMKLGLPPEIEYDHVWPGLVTLGALSALLAGLVAWRLDALTTVAWGLGAIVVLGSFTAACARVHRHYRHVVAGAVVLGALLALLVVTVHQQGYLDQVDALGSLDRSALNDSNSGR